MKYLILILTIFIIIGCNNKESKSLEQKEINNTRLTITKKEKTNDTIIIKDKDFNLTFQKNKLIYPKDKLVLLFYDNNFYSQEEEKILNKLKVKYFKTQNEYLKKYFNIQYYPTIVILDKNKTIKFENFTPYEILKTEGF